MRRSLIALILYGCLLNSDVWAQLNKTPYAPFFEHPNESDAIVLNGPIDGRTPFSFEKILAKKGQIRSIYLNSGGGQVRSALSIALRIRSLGITTLVPREGNCMSACSLIFFAGKRRFALGALGVHQLKSASGSEGAAQFALGDILDVLKDFEVPDEVLISMLRTPPEDMYVFTEKEKARFGFLDAPEVSPRTDPKPQRRLVCYIDDVRPPDDWLALRSEPTAKSGRQIRRLLRGQSFTMLGEQDGDWHRVTLPDGTRGWVSWAVRRWIRC